VWVNMYMFIIHVMADPNIQLLIEIIEEVI